MKYIIAIFFLLFIFALTYYLSITINNILNNEKKQKHLLIIITILQIVFFSLYIIKSKITKIISSYYMGYIFYFFWISLIIDIFLLITKKKINIKKNIKNNIKLIRILLPLLIVIIGHFNALTIRTTKYEITTTKNIEPTSIVLVSDIHLSYATKEKQIKNIVDKINNLNPDIVLITGDIFDGEYDLVDNLETIESHFKNIESRFGTYAILGNHDLMLDKENIEKFINNSNIILLEDTFIQLENITIIGRKETNDITRKDLSNLIQTIDKKNYTIVLDHEPDEIAKNIEENIDLQLSGHTHHGQIFPINFATNILFDVDYGHKNIKNKDVIVTSGVGYWGPPMRVGSISEIVNIKIQPE